MGSFVTLPGTAYSEVSAYGTADRFSLVPVGARDVTAVVCVTQLCEAYYPPRRAWRPMLAGIAR